MTEPTTGLVASRRGVRVDTETGWSSVVAMDAEDCERLAASFTAMARRLRERPDVVAAWDALAMLDTGGAKEDEIPEALIRADEREQLAEAGRLLPAGTRTVEQFAARVLLDGQPVEAIPEATTRERAEARVTHHDRERAENPGWRGSAELVRRYQHTTPWERVPPPRRRPSIGEALEALGDQPIGIQFWVCPIPGHSDRKEPDGRPVGTVDWRGDVAYCTAPDCRRNSQQTSEEKP